MTVADASADLPEPRRYDAVDRADWPARFDVPADAPIIDRQDAGEEGKRRLERAWSAPPGIGGIFAEPNNTRIGQLYIATGFLFFFGAGVLALLMRIQLAYPGNDFLDAATYNQFFTMHGTVMMFLFAVPIVEAFAVMLLPSMVGTRDMPFPWLSAFGYWCYALGGALVFSSLFFKVAPDGGWFMYPPLTGAKHSPGINTDIWILGLGFVEIAAVSAAVEIIVGILKTRAPGMSLSKMPIFAWYMLVTAGMIMLGMPAVIVADFLLELERAFDMPFFDPAKGGDPLLWQHLFWLFGHPEVYIIFLPAAGLVSMMLPSFARAKLVGYSWIVMAAVAIGFISFGLWVHHMYATGLPRLSLSLFAAASVAIAIPMGVQVFAWIATIWDGRPVLRTPMLFILGFLFIFTVGGLTGVMVAAVPFDWQAHDSYFIVAHLHYVLIGGMVFPIFGAVYYWAPVFFGGLLSERLGKWAFWLMFVGFNAAFLPMHVTGLRGMPRRVYTYPEGIGLDWLNLVSSIFAFVFAAGVALVLFDVVRAIVKGEKAPENPWDAPSLEWLSSNDPVGFRSLPIVRSRYPLWDEPELRDFARSGRGYLPGAPTGARESLVTGPITGEPEQILRLPGPSWIPFLAALAVAVFFGALTVKLMTAAAVAGAVAALLIGTWLWMRDAALPRVMADAGHGLALPLYRNDDQSVGYWAMVVVLISDTAVTAAIAFAHLFLWTGRPDAWPPEGQGVLDPVGALWTVLAIFGAYALFETAHRALAAGSKALCGAALVASLLGWAGALWAGWLWLSASGISPTADSYGASIWALLGWVAFHLGFGVVMALWCLARLAFGMLDEWRRLTLHVCLLFLRFTAPMAAIAALVVTGFPHVVR
jgi:cytochrome c oxidase subunit I+III